MRAFYEAVGPDLHRFIQTRLNDPHEAADVLQETMLEVWRQAHAFERRSAVRTWVFSIARNKAIDRVRRSAPTGPAPDEEIADAAPDPEAAMAALQDGDRLRECIGSLKTVHRAAIQLAYFRDLPYGEIAQIENCSIGTVKTRIHHAKRLLLHCLSKKPSRRGGGV